MAWFLSADSWPASLVVVGVSFIVFALVFLASDPVRALLPLDAPQAAVDSLRQTLGFNQPIPIQFLGFLGRAIRGDFGTSTRTLEPALGMVLEPACRRRSRWASAGVAVSLLISVPLGILAALPARVRGSTSPPARWRSPGRPCPGFVLGQVLILIFAREPGGSCRCRGRATRPT